jgi:hypothetical protein
VRRLWKLLDADAKRCLAEANPVAAGARAAAMLRMSRHLSQSNHMSIELSIACSMADGALKLLSDRIDPGMLPDQIRNEVKDALAALDTPDFMNGKQTVLADLDLSVRSYRAGKIDKDLEGHTFSKADQDRAAAEVEAAVSKVAAAWSSPDPPTALTAVSAGTSPAAQITLSYLPKLWKAVSETRQRVVAARKKFGA